ncbi:hypothetical protein NESM_000215700 [Novymonas esmeraldas]|uniref:EGF-like domain-containing protein n=1 Tax=Novymonas esmeraldas TaxID=1808958 RepID=A0AAW0F679_9TRYP
MRDTGMPSSPVQPHTLLCSSRLALLHLLFLLLLSNAHVAVSAATIVDYTVSSVTATELAALPPTHWARYRTMCGYWGVTQTWTDTSMMSLMFPRLSRSGMNASFYAWGDIPWYVNNMGFLSPTPYGMCKGFCKRTLYSQLQGNYAFTENRSELYDGGGDWPMIGFYVAPFEVLSEFPLSQIIANETLASDTTSSIVPPSSPTDYASGPGRGSAVAYTTLEYCKVSLSGQSASASAQLTAQVAVYANGTIIMRYASLPSPSALAGVVPSTGLIYSKTRRTVVPPPTAANGIVAYRFDPVLDPCTPHTSLSACTLDTGNNCVWCSSTAACSTSGVVAEVCPRGQWTTPASSVLPFPPQNFYSVAVDITTPFVPLSSYAYTSQLSTGSFQLRLENARWNIPLFRTPTPPSISCIPGASCPTLTTTHLCGLVDNTCVNGNYTFSILALDSNFIFAAEGTWVARLLPPRNAGGQLCSEAGGCPNGVVGQLSGAAFNNNNSAMPLFSVQIYGDQNGVIDIIVVCARCVTGDPMLTFPAMRVGLVRYGVEDASSVLIPQGLLRSGVHARFVPITACADCGPSGWCNEATGTCQCQPGYFGSSCTACPVCWTGSRCDDGKNGGGSCLCSGGACAAACAGLKGGSGGSGGVTVPAQSCWGCSAVGGRCNCGVCECVDGWSGPGCSVPPADACRAYSFDGCAVCGQQPGCVFCYDSTCFNPALSGTPGGYTCSYSTPAADTEACVTYGSRGLFAPVSVAYKRMAVGVVVTVTIFMAVLALCILRCCFRHRRVYDPMAMLAVGGTPDIPRTQQEREVVQVSFVRRRVAGRQIMGIPLRQMTLQRLYKRRMEERSVAVVNDDQPGGGVR